MFTALARGKKTNNPSFSSLSMGGTAGNNKEFYDEESPRSDLDVRARPGLEQNQERG